jgi:hypothetical protein
VGLVSLARIRANVRREERERIFTVNQAAFSVRAEEGRVEGRNIELDRESEYKKAGKYTARHPRVLSIKKQPFKHYLPST